MASPKSRITAPVGSSRQAKAAGTSTVTTAFFAGHNAALPKGAVGFTMKVPRTTSKVFTGKAKQVKTLLQGYGKAVAKSLTDGTRVSFRVDVDPKGETVVTPVEVVPADVPVTGETITPDAELEVALAAARERGRLKAAEILGGEDMLSSEAFAKMLGTSRMTVNTKRQSGQVLGLDGSKRGFRFPVWQLDAEGKPYPALEALHDRLGGPWAVYRFLVQTHGELDGLTGLQALEQGKAKAALKAAEGAGRDFR